MSRIFFDLGLLFRHRAGAGGVEPEVNEIVEAKIKALLDKIWGVEGTEIGVRKSEMGTMCFSCNGCRVDGFPG